MSSERERIRVVFAGHVDHGKSSVIGRLMHDTGSVYPDKIRAVREFCERNARPFEYAFLLDTLSAERAQGVTIDAAKVVLRSRSREYAVVDAPGHSDFIRNMVTGASYADLACLVVDAAEGLRENSRRHAYLLALLGVSKVILIVNKMDLVHYSEHAFSTIEERFKELSAAVGLQISAAVPACATQGDNIVQNSASMGWYAGDPLFSILERFTVQNEEREEPPRMFVQDVYKFTEHGDSRRIIAGTVLSGTLRPDEQVMFYPSARRSRIRTIEDRTEARAGEACGITLADETFITRGQLMVKAGSEIPSVSTRFEVQIFWLAPMEFDRSLECTIRLGAARTQVRLAEVKEALDLATLEVRPNASSLRQYELGRCVLKSRKELAFTQAGLCVQGARFVIVSGHRISGAGLALLPLPDEQGWVREKLQRRQEKWERSLVQPGDRARRFGQKPALVLITGPAVVDRKAAAKLLEAQLFNSGRAVYFLSLGNLVYGIDADIARGEGRHEHMRRLAEVANVMLDAGLILLVSAADLRESDLAIIRTLLDPLDVISVWLGSEKASDLRADLVLEDPTEHLTIIRQVNELLEERQIIYKPW